MAANQESSNSIIDDDPQPPAVPPPNASKKTVGDFIVAYWHINQGLSHAEAIDYANKEGIKHANGNDLYRFAESDFVKLYGGYGRELYTYIHSSPYGRVSVPVVKFTAFSAFPVS